MLTLWGLAVRHSQNNSPQITCGPIYLWLSTLLINQTSVMNVNLQAHSYFLDLNLESLASTKSFVAGGSRMAIVEARFCGFVGKTST